jgi:4-alpha-glucanotransferase
MTIRSRSSGILMHISSLPSKYGIGDLGQSAYEFVDFLSDTGTKYWQVLPLNPTGFGDSPYQGLSAFAGNPLFIDPDFHQIFQNKK